MKKAEIIPIKNEVPAQKTYEQKTNVWFFENEEDEAMGIETFSYPNGGISKRCKLKDGREAVSHLLKGKDRINIKRITGGKAEMVQDAVIALSTKIDGKAIVIEDIDELWFNDLTKIQSMASTINFM